MNIYNFTLEELENYLIENGFKKFNATQLIEWIYEKKIYDFDKMTNLSKKLIEFLKQNVIIEKLNVVKTERSKLANKYLIELSDSNKIECVLMNHDYGYSLCVSSQVGCNMGCSFCESGRLKKVRDLQLNELIGQIICVQEYENIRIDSVVVMGIGEPFDNFENIKRFISVVTHNKMIGIGQRHLTISTCGLVPKIRELAELNLQITLAISLHAPNDDIRKTIMPIANKHSIEELLSACEYYFKKTGRRITFEYSLINGVNDSLKEAKELAERIKHINGSHVNLIPINPIKERTFKQGTQEEISEFKKLLEKYKINVTIRREMGRDIQGACGQLRKSYSEQETGTNDEKEEIF